MTSHPPAEWPRGLPIGKAAALLGTTPKALRTYHAKGLVPEPPRDVSGYRRYDSGTLVQLARVRRLRELGLSLAAIAPTVAGNDAGAALQSALRTLDAELSEQAHGPASAGSPPPLPDPARLAPEVRRRLGTTRRRFHALEGASADDPRIEPLVPDMADALIEAMTAGSPAEEDQNRSAADVDADPEVAIAAFGALLEALPIAQRRVVEGVMTSMLASA